MTTRVFYIWKDVEMYVHTQEAVLYEFRSHKFIDALTALDSVLNVHERMEDIFFTK